MKDCYLVRETVGDKTRIVCGCGWRGDLGFVGSEVERLSQVDEASFHLAGMRKTIEDREQAHRKSHDVWFLTIGNNHMNSTAGGIGALGAAQREAHDTPDETETGIDLQPTASTRDRWEDGPLKNSDGHIIASVAAEARAATEAVHDAITEAGQRLTALEAALGQLQGQHNQVEMSLPQHAQAINTLDARLNVVAQQVARNLRLAALDAATKCRQPGENAGGVLKNAEMFLAWLEPPPPVPAPVEAAPDAPGDGDIVRH